MTDKQRRFAAEYLIDHNATQAAIRAGYSRRSAMQHGHALLRKHEIQLLVQEGTKRHLEAAGLSAKRVLEELRRLAFIDIRAFYREDGSLKHPSELTEEQGSQLASLETIIKNAEGGDGHTDVVHKIKLWPKEHALGMLCKHFALLKDVTRVETDEEVVRRLQQGRERATRTGS